MTVVRKGSAVILVCGEALVDLVEVESSPSGPLLRALPGGGPANTAVALARLGQRVALATRLGRDAGGDIVRAHLSRNGVEDGFIIDAAEPTTLALVTVGPNGDARYRFYFAHTAGWAWSPSELPACLPAEIAAVHLGSMAVACEPGFGALSAFVSRVRNDATISLDPNVRLEVVDDLARYRDELESLVARCHLVRASEEDLAALYPGADAVVSARRWAGLGPRLVVVTRGGAAPLALLGEAVLEGPTRPVTLVDTVGAGDTFSAALLDSLARRGLLAHRLDGLGTDDVRLALERAVAASSITCERQGADPPRAEEVAARLAEG